MADYKANFFVLAGVAYKPTDVNTVLQNGNEKSYSARKTKKVNYDKNDKNHKNILNQSTNDSVTKRRQQTSLVAKPSAARQLCLDTSRRKDSKTKVIDPTKTPPAQEAADDTVLNDRLTTKDASMPQSTSVATTEKCENSVKVDTPFLKEVHLQLERVDSFLKEFHLQLERMDLRIHDIGEDAVQQNNKCSLSNISQNKSASQPSQSVPEDKSSAIHTLPSQKKANVALDCVTEEVPEAGVFTNEANKRKRQATDGDKSSDSSSTGKENVEKDSANISVPSQSKKLKKDGVLHNMPSAARNMTFEDLNVSPKNKHDKKISQAVELSARRSSLRNRSLLASPETLMKELQYPSAARNMTFEDLNVSPKNKHDKKISQAVELSARQSSLRNRSLLASPETLMKERQYPSAARNMTFEDLNVSQKNKHDKKISQTVELSTRRSSLRNRSLLASPETLMKERQYPVFHVAEKKNVPEKNVPVVNNVSCVEMGSSVNRKTPKHILLRELEISKGTNTSRDTLNKTPLPELELSKVKDTSNYEFRFIF